jgi:hypothetical protein
MSYKQTAKEVFLDGRGGGRGLPKTNEEVVHQESEVMEPDDLFPSQDGLEANYWGGKPIWATGSESAFHTGRGPGRGHGPA